MKRFKQIITFILVIKFVKHTYECTHIHINDGLIVSSVFTYKHKFILRTYYNKGKWDFTKVKKERQAAQISQKKEGRTDILRILQTNIC